MKEADIQPDSQLSSIEREIRRLGPWHFKMSIDDDGKKFTTDYNQVNKSQTVKNVVDPFVLEKTFRRLYRSNGFKGKSFMDIGCNGGGYCFVANKMGAEYAYGFDVRQKWIDQGLLLRDKVFKLSPEKMHFQVSHIHELEQLNRKFDITLFKGVLYHIPDPIHSLKIVCDMTNEVLILNTAGSMDAPDDCMKMFFEDPNSSMAGIDNMAWLPGSPQLLKQILEWCGFSETRIYQQIQYVDRPHMQRIGILAARDKKFFRSYDRFRANHKLPLNEGLTRV